MVLSLGHFVGALLDYLIIALILFYIVLHNEGAEEDHHQVARKTMVFLATESFDVHSEALHPPYRALPYT